MSANVIVFPMLRPLVPVLVEKDLAEQYASAAGVLDLRELLAGIGDVMTFGEGDPTESVTTSLYWDTTGKVLWVNDPVDGWTEL